MNTLAAILASLLVTPLSTGPTASDTTVTRPGPPAPAVCERAGSASRAQEDDNAGCAVIAFAIPEDRAPELDGRLDDEAWAQAQPATGFRQQEPTPGASASHATEARILFTDEAVYVGMRMFDDDPTAIRSQFVRRDDHEAVSDWASVMFDSYHDRRTAFEFTTTPTGARVDVLHREDVLMDPTWDAVWEVATHRDGDGWVAEFRIPLSQLRFSGEEDMVWGVNFRRSVARLSETSYWAPIPPTAGRGVSLYGDLKGLSGLSAPGGMEVLPYTVGRLTRSPGDPQDPFYEKNDTWSSVGLDLKYGLTSNLTLTATVNPDFGQVEADPSQVNLTAFETRYDERRPFFTEGTEIFDFQMVPEGFVFYSRRVGRAPQLRPQVPAGEYADRPETAPILGALKLSGKTAGGWSVGLMNAVTGGVDAKVTEPGGIASQPIEPMTNYAVGRIMRDFREGRSGIGVLGTGTHRRLDDPAFDGLRSSAYAGAFDWFHRFGRGGNYEFNGWLVGSHARGSADAMAATQRSSLHFFTRPDADHLTYDPAITSMTGWGSEVAVLKRGGRWTWQVGGGSRSPGIEINDIGFLSYADAWYANARGRYAEFQPRGILRSWHIEGEGVQAYTFGMESFRRSVHLRLRGNFLNFWQATVNSDRWSNHLWPWELRGGPALLRPGYTNVRWTLRSDSRKPWRANLRGTVRREHQGGSRLITFDPTLDFRPTSRLTVSLGPRLSMNRDAAQYVARVDDVGTTGYVLGQIEQTTASLDARFSYGFSPTLNLDVYAQPFLSNGTYSQFRTVADPGAEDFDTRLPLIPSGALAFDAAANRYATAGYSFRNPDFNVREFRLNAVLRWEYKPGSSLFVVWTQAREDYERFGDFEFSRDVDRLFMAPATNVFMIKANYWIGF